MSTEFRRIRPRAAARGSRSFLQRTPQQRLDWLLQALEIAYQCGALRTRMAADGERA